MVVKKTSAAGMGESALLEGDGCGEIGREAGPAGGATVKAQATGGSVGSGAGPVRRRGRCQRPKRRERLEYSRRARRKSMRRKAGQ